MTVKKPKSSNIALQDFISEDQFFAIRSLEEGKASPAQQKIALKAIVENVCALYQISYEESNPSHTVFNEGRRWVGRFIYEAVVVASASYFKAKTPKPNINK